MMFFDILINLIVAAFVICIVVLIIQEIKETLSKKAKEKQKQLDIELRQKEREKNRLIYYNNLNNVYDYLSISKLEAVIRLLNIINDSSKQYREYFKNPSKPHTNLEVLEERWTNAIEELKIIINPEDKYLWKTSQESLKDPLWPDLDLKYVENLLKRK